MGAYWQESSRYLTFFGLFLDMFSSPGHIYQPCENKNSHTFVCFFHCWWFTHLFISSRAWAREKKREFVAHRSNLETEERACLRRQRVHILRRCLGDDWRPMKVAATKERKLRRMERWPHSIIWTFEWKCTLGLSLFTASSLSVPDLLMAKYAVFRLLFNLFQEVVINF